MRSNGFFKKFPEAQRKDIILFLSRIDPKKGVELLLDAFGIVPQSQQDVVLVIAGKGSSRTCGNSKNTQGAFSRLQDHGQQIRSKRSVVSGRWSVVGGHRR